ncbi:hypothetical protein [Ruegeria hyattellae]|uniref:hypothetical protein n=1 Tax=Ruegeria hyattellae TaxID=3233337 RepID=UPI00355AE6AC
MLKFFKNFRSSDKFMDRLSLEMGVDRRLFKTALTELGINFSDLEKEFEQRAVHERESGFSDDVIMQRACMGIISYARLGASQLIVKFGEQPEIESFMFAMIDYQEAHIDVVDDPEAYRRERMY